MTQEENKTLFLTGEMEGGIRVNFYERAIEENAQPIERVHLEKESNEKVTRKQIINIYCDKCKDVWFNNLIDNYDECDQRIIRTGALMVSTNRFEVYDMLKEMDMPDELKKEVLQTYIDECDKRNKISININA